MDPYQQQYQPPVGNSYDFIMNPQKPPKQRKFGIGRNSSLGMLLGLIVGGAVLFMIVVAVVLSMFSSNSAGVSLTGIAQTQNELIRVADQGVRGSVRQTTKNLAVTIQYGLTTQQKQTIAYMARTGVSIAEKELALKQNATTDQRLASAKTTSTFDSVFAEIMQEQLTAYADSVRQLHNTTTNKTEKELLGTYYEQTQLLISQIPYTQESIESEQ